LCLRFKSTLSPNDSGFWGSAALNLRRASTFQSAYGFDVSYISLC